MKTLIDFIHYKLEIDIKDREKSSKALVTIYQHSSKVEREKIDLIFIMLCGYRLSSIIEEFTLL